MILLLAIRALILATTNFFLKAKPNLAFFNTIFVFCFCIQRARYFDLFATLLFPTTLTPLHSTIAMSKPTPSLPPMSPPALEQLPSELHVNILTFLRAYDLSAINQTCRTFASKTLVHKVIKETAENVYPRELTKGFELEGCEYTFESLRNMEWLVVARVLSRPEPSRGGFYVSKSWCKSALKWLEVQQEEQKQRSIVSSKKNEKRMSKKKLRVRNRRLSDVSPPWPNVNSDLMCCHEKLQHCPSTRNARGRRRLLDKQAWKVLKKLYPDSVSMDTESGECLQCRIEEETAKLALKQQDERETEERRKPLASSVVRGIYTRTRGVPTQSVISDGPLAPGLYHVLPRAWLYSWRRYLKSGDGDPPRAPDASDLLCYDHRLPLIPPHLEAYLYGETSHLWASKDNEARTTLSPVNAAACRSPAGLPVGMSPVDAETLNALRAAGISQQELDAQRALSMSALQPRTPSRRAVSNNELLDMENSVVVEILTAEEFAALEKSWPDIQPTFDLRFSVSGDDICWSTPPCRACDPSSRNYDLSVRHCIRTKKAASLKKPPVAGLEY